MRTYQAFFSAIDTDLIDKRSDGKAISFVTFTAKNVTQAKRMASNRLSDALYWSNSLTVITLATETDQGLKTVATKVKDMTWDTDCILDANNQPIFTVPPVPSKPAIDTNASADSRTDGTKAVEALISRDISCYVVYNHIDPNIYVEADKESLISTLYDPRINEQFYMEAHTEAHTDTYGGSTWTEVYFGEL